MIDTQVSKLSRSGSEDGPSSVIHAPSGFKKLKDGGSEPHSPTEGSENTVVSPDTPEAVRSPKEKVRPVHAKSTVSADGSTVEVGCHVASQHRRPTGQ